MNVGYSWVDECFAQWLLEQGVHWVAGFASLGEDDQHRVQGAWLESGGQP